MKGSPVPETYVDRAGLDARLVQAFEAGKHVAIHGGSQHGKSWLRAHGLRDRDVARVQCLPNMTAEGAVAAVLGAIDAYEPGKRTVGRTKEKGTSGKVRAAVPLDLTAGGTTKTGATTQAESQPVASTSRNLGWVAAQLLRARRRPVFEDFHNLAPDEQRTLAFTIKALGEHGAPCVVVGIFPDNSLLTYYNGELVNRITDLHVTWSGEELEQVVMKGCVALNVDLAQDLRRLITRSSYASVGLLQELAHKTMVEAGVTRRGLRAVAVTDADVVIRAVDQAVQSMAGRFDTFYARFQEGEGEATDRDVFAHLLWAVVERLDDQDLIEGVRLSALTGEMSLLDATRTADEVRSALERVEAVQERHLTHPAVLAFDRPRGRLFLADRGLLLYRRHRKPSWRWEG